MYENRPTVFLGFSAAQFFAKRSAGGFSHFRFLQNGRGGGSRSADTSGGSASLAGGPGSSAPQREVQSGQSFPRGVLGEAGKVRGVENFLDGEVQGGQSPPKGRSREGRAFLAITLFCHI